MGKDKEDSAEKRIRKFANQVAEMRSKEALDDESLAFIHKFLVTGAFPHSNPKKDFYSIVNGKHAIWVRGGSDVDTKTGKKIKHGVPYGTLPRLITSWITTEAYKKKSRKIQLGLSLSHFLKMLDLDVAGGKNGTINRVKDQLQRLCHCEIGYKTSTNKEGKIHHESRRYKLISGEEFWEWKQPGQTELFGSYILLTEGFFNKLMERPVPVDMRALKTLKSSALALDLYMWLTYRVSYLDGHTELNWNQVMNQLGAEYKHTHRFAQKCKKHLKKIKAFWPELNYKTPYGRLRIEASVPHIKPGS